MKYNNKNNNIDQKKNDDRDPRCAGGISKYLLYGSVLVYKLLQEN